MITADGGGSNRSQVRLWKTELQKLADEIGMDISVCHFPPGTNKWNKIEHRLFSQITKNWRGRPLVSYEVIVNLIKNTTTQTGLEVKCELDKNQYQKRIKISNNEFKIIKIKRNYFHGEWNSLPWILRNTNYTSGPGAGIPIRVNGLSTMMMVIIGSLYPRIIEEPRTDTLVATDTDY